MLDRKKHYLQVALNSTPSDARDIISKLPISDRIIIEAGTPLIKEYGAGVIQDIRSYLNSRSFGSNGLDPYIVADMKCMDRGEEEARIAADNGASAAVALGQAPTETLNSFIQACKASGIDSMIDMMNVEKPYQVIRKLKDLPTVVILHRGVDEEQYSDKMLPIHMINKIKGTFNVIVAVAGGDSAREIQSASFNGADIIVVWKNFYTPSEDIESLANNFLANIK